MCCDLVTWAGPSHAHELLALMLLRKKSHFGVPHVLMKFGFGPPFAKSDISHFSSRLIYFWSLCGSTFQRWVLCPQFASFPYFFPSVMLASPWTVMTPTALTPQHHPPSRHTKEFKTMGVALLNPCCRTDPGPS
jgi:hypothetical protein